jgi:hypothetical protein
MEECKAVEVNLHALETYAVVSTFILGLFHSRSRGL